MAFRSFIGSCATLTTSVMNLTILMVLKGEPGYICLMCCNADILFCVIVLHWVTSKEQKEEDSAPRSRTHDLKNSKSGNGPVGLNTIGSHTVRSHRLSNTIEIDELENTLSNISTCRTPDPHMHNPATIVTECKATPGGVVRYIRSRRASWNAADTKPGMRDDEVELHNIRVHTVQTREVEIDGEAESRRSASMGTDTGEEWMGSRRGVVGERMV
jgi:hypothetical protein